MYICVCIYVCMCAHTYEGHRLVLNVLLRLFPTLFFNTSFLKISFAYVWMFCHTYACISYVCLQRPEEGIGSLWIGVTDAGELPGGYWEENPSPL